MNRFIKLLAWLLCALAVLPFAVSCDNGSSATTDTSTDREASEQTTETRAQSESQAVTETANTESETQIEAEAEISVTVDKNENSASLSYSDGLSYSATGYIDLDAEGCFTINNGLVLDFTNGHIFDCNRFIITYSSEAPVEIKITYKTQDGNVTDNYFLEAAERGVFKGLVSGFLDSAYSSTLISMTADTCEKKNAKLSIHSFKGDLVESISGSTCYIENTKFKLGVKLSWGGGINYIEDKTYKDVRGLKNLCNMHDTGRLIQQSYYGTGAIPGVYEVGSFSSSSNWPYNPVQGGDKMQNKSRLIDFEITENSIYVKAQPQDWGKDNAITPSYMENVYTLTDDYIEVYNRFVDFSGWEHVYRGQELPAFYTISYLDTFYFYNGTKPWTGDELTVKPDLPSWGASANAGKCNFYLREGNTETWNAWVNGETNWGIGLYTPNIDRLKAGRSAYDGSKNPSANSTNYVAAYNQIKLTSFLPVEYSYLITTGTVEEIRAVFTENKDFTDNASLNVNRQSTRIPSGDFDYTNLDFSNPSYVKVFLSFNTATAAFDENEKAVMLTATDGTDPFAIIDYTVASKTLMAEDYTTLVIEYMIPTTNSTTSYIPDLFLSTGELIGASSKARYRPSSNYVVDGQYHTLEIPVSTLDYWSGQVNKIRFDFFTKCAAGDVIYIRSIKLQ